MWIRIIFTKILHVWFTFLDLKRNANNPSQVDLSNLLYINQLDLVPTFFMPTCVSFSGMLRGKSQDSGEEILTSNISHLPSYSSPNEISSCNIIKISIMSE